MVKLEAKKLLLKGVFHGGLIAVYEILTCTLLIYLYLLVDPTVNLNSPLFVLILFINIFIPFIYIGCQIKRKMQLSLFVVYMKPYQYFLFYPLGIAFWVTTWASFYSDVGLYIIIFFPFGLIFHTIMIATALSMGSWFCKLK